MMTRFRNTLLATTALMPLGIIAAAANPLGSQVVGGTASVQGQGTSTVTVTQSTDRAIINWNSFSIGSGETTRFTQPNASSVTLNRVTGNLGPSFLDGTMTANGRVFLVNPDGILFGAGSKINTGSFLATTNDIRNADFMAGRYQFNIPGRSDASITNLGTITAQNGGFAALVAPGVRNRGTITANLGTVGLAAGNNFSLDFYGDRLITLGVNDSIAARVIDVATGRPLNALVKNEGTLKANSGRVELTAVAARQVVDAVINNTGVIEANSIGSRNGMIVLGAATRATRPTGGPTQTVRVSGTLSAAGKSRETKGGTIVVTGENIELAAATIDASGQAGGGKILIGGDVGGGKGNAAVAANPKAALESLSVATASTVSVDAATTIDASAKARGDGGKIIVWSDQATTFYGTIKAQGGAMSGSGGFVEVSSHQQLTFDGLVNTSASSGAVGTLLLDPTNTTIATSPGAGIITVASIQNALASGNVLVSTVGTFGSQIGDITIAAPVSWSSGNTLTLSAANNISINAALTGANGGLTLSAGNFGFSALIADTAPISVGTFILQNGNWHQVSTNLPSFFARDFRLSLGSSFLRALSGNGSNVSPYQITDMYGLQGMYPQIFRTPAPRSYVLANNIEAAGAANWNGGTGFRSLFEIPVGAVLDGQNHTINNLTLNLSNGGFVFLNSGTIRNLGLTNVSTTGTAPLFGGIVGLLVDLNSGGLISNSFVTGTIAISGQKNGTLEIGGLVGTNGSFLSTPGTIDQSYTSVNINVSAGTFAATSLIAGGLAGFNTSVISNSRALGNISGGPNSSVGGLVGQNGSFDGFGSGLISQSYAAGSITGSTGGGLAGVNFGTITNSNATGSVFTDGFAGGLVGANGGYIMNSRATGAVVGNSNGIGWAGGLAGANYGAISQSYASGSVIGNTAGGLVAVNNGSITASFATGSVVGRTNSVVGGLVGDGQASSSITQSYSTGSVTGGSNSFVGGLVGSLDYSASISGSYATGFVNVGSFNPASGNMNSLAGGLVGTNSGTISMSYATSQVLGGSGSINGGLVGANAGLISQSFATGNVTAGDNSLVGGLSGVNLIATVTTQNFFTGPTSQTSSGKISQSYATGSVTGGANSFVAGLVAENSGSIDQAYAVGPLKGGSGSTLGGLVALSSFAYPPGSGPGPNEIGSTSPGKVTNSYWDIFGTGQTISAGGNAMTTAQLAAGLPSGFNSSTWIVNPGSSYPYLRWQSGNIPTPSPSALSAAASVASAQLFGQIANLKVPINWNIANSTPSTIKTVKPTTADAIEAVNQLADFVQGCASNCLQGTSITVLNLLVSKALEASGVVPQISSESTRYRIIVATTNIAIDVVLIGAIVAAGPEVAAAVGTVALVFTVSELLVRPIVGSN